MAIQIVEEILAVIGLFTVVHFALMAIDDRCNRW